MSEALFSCRWLPPLLSGEQALVLMSQLIRVFADSVGV